MKNLKMILIPIGIMVFLGGVFAFTQHPSIKKEGDKKCKIQIIKNINGVETVVDSTFDCPDDMTWIEELHEEIDGDSIHKMIKMIMAEGDSNEFTFDFNFDFDESEDGAMKIMKFKGDDGEEMEMKFDFKEMGEEGGSMKMVINGKEMKIEMDQLHEHLEKMHEHIDMVHDESGNLEVVIEDIKGEEGSHMVKIIKEVDDDGNVTVKKIVDGKEVEIDEEDIHEIHGKHKMMFISDGKERGENHEMTVDVQVEMEDGKETKHIVIITKVSGDKEKDVAKKIPAAKENLDKKELSVNKLKFSPNPNDGKFDLSFKLSEKEPVSIKIFDMQGKEVYNEQINSFSGKYNNNIDISEKGEGIYILQIVQNDKASTNKIVIK